MNNTFKTDNIGLASFLKAKGAILTHIGADDKRRFFFAFEDEVMCVTLKYEYLNNAEVSAKALFEARDMFINEIKTIQT